MHNDRSGCLHDAVHINILKMVVCSTFGWFNRSVGQNKQRFLKIPDSGILRKKCIMQRKGLISVINLHHGK